MRDLLEVVKIFGKSPLLLAWLVVVISLEVVAIRLALK